MDGETQACKSATSEPTFSCNVLLPSIPEISDKKIADTIDRRNVAESEESRDIRNDSPLTVSSDETRQTSESIPLVVLQERNTSSTHNIDLDLVQGILDLKRIKASVANKSFVVDSDGDIYTLCTISTHESMDLDYRGLYWPDGEDSSSSNDGVYFESTSSSSAADDVDSLDYSFSRSQDFWKLYEDLMVRDEQYFTEGFIDVGELPRVYWCQWRTLCRTDFSGSNWQLDL